MGPQILVICCVKSIKFAYFLWGKSGAGAISFSVIDTKTSPKAKHHKPPLV